MLILAMCHDLSVQFSKRAEILLFAGENFSLKLNR